MPVRTSEEIGEKKKLKGGKNRGWENTPSRKLAKKKKKALKFRNNRSLKETKGRVGQQQSKR